MKKVRREHPSVFLVFACYLLCIVGWLLVDVGQLAYNRVLHQNGTLETTRLTVADFSLQEMEPMDGGFLTTGSDPQMIYSDAAQRVDTVRARIQYRTPPVVETAFYAAPGQPYSIRQMEYAQQEGEDSLFLLPAGGGQSLRIDPDATAGNLLWIEEIILNEKRPVYKFFIPSATEGALLLVGPALLASAVSVCLEIRRAWKGRKKEVGA